MSSFAHGMAVHDGSSESWAAAALVRTHASESTPQERWAISGNGGPNDHNSMYMSTHMSPHTASRFRYQDGAGGDDYEEDGGEDHDDNGHEEIYEEEALTGAEAKKKLKRAANRRSAQLSRQRKKKYIEELTQQYTKFKRSKEILSIISDVVFLFDERGDVLFVSDAVRDALGAEDPASQIVGKPVYSLLTPGSVRQLQEMLERVCRTHQTSLFDHNETLESLAATASAEQQRRLRRRASSDLSGSEQSPASAAVGSGRGQPPPEPLKAQGPASGGGGVGQGDVPVTYELDRCALQFMRLDNGVITSFDVTGTAATVEGFPRQLQFVCSARPRGHVPGRSPKSSSEGSSVGSTRSSSSSRSMSSSSSSLSSNAVMHPGSHMSEKSNSSGGSAGEGGGGSDDGSGSPSNLFGASN